MSSLRRRATLLFFVSSFTACALGACDAAADEIDVVPAAPEIGPMLTFDEALRIFKQRGLDILIADAAVRNAEGAVKIAGAVPNPVVSASVGNAITYNAGPDSRANCLQNGASCPPWQNTVGITDSAALEDTLSGKRDLRQQVQRAALAAAKMSRLDAERTVGLQVKAAYVQVVQAVLAFKFAKEIAETQATTLKRFQDRYKGGAINEGDLQRIEVQKLEADQAADTAGQNLRQARAALAFLLGVRGAVSSFDVETNVLDFAVPVQLRDTNEVTLLRTAFDHRPDLLGAGYLKQQAEAQIQLVKRQRFPDITLGVSYQFGGFGGFSTNGPVGQQIVSFSVSAPLPVFNNLAGEQRQAQAQYETNALQQAKTTAQVVNDVISGYAAFEASKRQVERMEGPRRPGGGLLQSARGAFEIVATQYEKGAASLTDYLDALRTYIATKSEYFGDLTSYWSAVFQLEAAVARDLR
jgi:cobalt-zinc-cadmium efflux system outer membrane protein